LIPYILISAIVGGTHDNELSANSLVAISAQHYTRLRPFANVTSPGHAQRCISVAYLELILFTHPESHFLPSSPSHDRTVCHAPALHPPERAPEVAGGRRWTDGREVRWEITLPTQWAEKEGGLRLPFFSDDVTPRELRVRFLQYVFIPGKHTLTCDNATLLSKTND
jgi:hypothetical protein